MQPFPSKRRGSKDRLLGDDMASQTQEVNCGGTLIEDVLMMRTDIALARADYPVRPPFAETRIKVGPVDFR